MHACSAVPLQQGMTHLSPVQDEFRQRHGPEVGGEEAGIQPLGDLCKGE